MAELIVSTLIQALINKLLDEAVKQVGRVQGIHSELESLKETLYRIQALLVDASDKEIKDVRVQNWLNDLKHLAYDIDDILDDLATDDMHPELVKNSGASTSKVRKIASSVYNKFSLFSRTSNRFDNINQRLEDLENQKTTIGLNGGLEVRNNRSRDINRLLETSLVDASSIVGRQGDKDELIDKLLGDNPRSENFSIVPIVGMGGVGKTTLAKIVYDDKQVNDHFTCKAWVCVSEEWDSVKISNIIFQSVTGETKEFRDLNLLQIALRDQLRGKQFLLVLDDVWTDNIEDWKNLVPPFSVCARGSKVIITTRKDKLLRDLRFRQLNQLQCLSLDDAMSLFCQNALDANNFDSYPTLKAYGIDIVGRCNGLPLALIALGRLLWRKEGDEEGWKEVVDSKIWTLEEGGGIIPALKLSYRELPASLKQLFAYCSLFPKDYLFDKDDLVLLWMAEGFLHQSDSSESKTMERIGLGFFNDLLSRSFFQRSPNDESLYVMHDLMNDLATSVAIDFFFRIEKGGKPRKPAWDKYRHISFIFEEYGDYRNFKGMGGPKGLRTFLSLGVKERWLSHYLLNQVLVDILPQLQFLRVLSLSGYEINELPDSIGKLKHLRYLNLSRTKITQLPENVCDLYNLETMILFGCSCLTKFPKNFRKLKSLRYLDIRDTPLLEDSPLGTGELKSLQTLTKIVIGVENEFSITQPKGFEIVQGKIVCNGLDKVLNGTKSQEEFLSQKRFTELEVEWSDVSDPTRNDTTESNFLGALEPDKKCLKRLGIVNYLGLEFPKWVGDPLFQKLTRVSIRGCKKCTSLPAIGKLPSLKELSIQEMDDVKDVGSEFLGTGLAFPRLEVLSFEGMWGWEVWSTNVTSTSTGDVVKAAVFPRLKELRITNCPNLVNVSLETLPLLKHLDISSCGGGVLRSLVHAGQSVTELIIVSISGLTNEVWSGVILDLKAVEELIVKKCDEIEYLWESKEVLVGSRMLVNLRKLKVESCKNLVRLGEKDDKEHNDGSNLLTFLWSLEVWSCEKFEHLSCPNNIEVLQIFWCDSITCVSFSTGGRQKLRSVTFHECKKILLKEELQGEENFRPLLINSKSMPMLEYLWIHDHPNLASLIESRGEFIRLATMSIADCKSAVESLFADLERRCLTKITNLELFDCPSMDAPGHWPPNLRRLKIGRLKKPISEWDLQQLPTSLVEVIIRGDEVTDRSQLSNLGLPSSVTQLSWH